MHKQKHFSSSIYYVLKELTLLIYWYFDFKFDLDTYPWACPGVSLHQVGLELIHLVLGGGSHGRGVDLVHSVSTQMGRQLDDDRGPPRAPLCDQHGVGGLVGGGNGPGQATHLFYYSLKKFTTFQYHSFTLTPSPFDFSLYF